VILVVSFVISKKHGGTECVYIYMIDWPEKENDDLLIYTQRKKLSTPMFF
jgi:hypothetical protein